MPGLDFLSFYRLCRLSGTVQDGQRSTAVNVKSPPPLPMRLAGRRSRSAQPRPQTGPC